jgi:uncharacterized protein
MIDRKNLLLGAAYAVLGSIETGRLQMDMFTEDARWWSNLGASWPLDEFGALLEDLHGRTEDGIAVSPFAATVDGDRVAIEAESRAKLHDGTAYNNRYHFLFIFRGNLIAEVKEYSDTHHVMSVFNLAL